MTHEHLLSTSFYPHAYPDSSDFLAYFNQLVAEDNEVVLGAPRHKGQRFGPDYQQVRWGPCGENGEYYVCTLDCFGAILYFNSRQGFSCVILLFLFLS